VLKVGPVSSLHSSFYPRIRHRLCDFLCLLLATIGCREQAVYSKVYRRTLPYHKFGRKVIFLR
jgi:hypothetical protein